MRLSPDEVHVWRANLRHPVHGDGPAAEATASMAIRRAILGRYIGCPADAVAFGEDQRGKPRIERADAAIEFSVSHSHGVLLVAVADGRAVGVDVELVRERVSIERVARRAFTAGERRALSRLPEPLQRDTFFRTWACKEAYVKGRAVGLAGMRKVEVDVAPPSEPRVVWAHEQLPEEEWRLLPVDAPEGFVASLAVALREPDEAVRLRTFDWPADDPERTSRQPLTRS